MRLIISVLALFALTLGRPVAAQTFGQEWSALGTELQSEETRDRALERVERNPGAHPPVVFFAVTEVLQERGQVEDAQRWAYFGQLRFLTDIMALSPDASLEMRNRLLEMLSSVVIDLPAVRRREILQEAIRLDRRTPRLYGSVYLGVFSSADGAWPSDRAMNNARDRAIELLQAQLVVTEQRETDLAAIDAQIKEGAITQEAIDFIPEPWRSRVRPIRSARMPSQCGEIARQIAATPAQSEPQAFVILCEPSRSMTFSRGEGVLNWLSGSDLSLLASTASPDRIWDGMIAVRDGAPYALFNARSGGQATGVLVSTGGRVEVLPSGGLVGALNAVSPSGRYAMRHRLSEVEVIDLETGAIVFRRAPPPPAAGGRTAREQFGYLAERGGQLELVGFRTPLQCNPQGPCPGQVLVIDVRTSRERLIPLERLDATASIRAHGAHQAFVEFRPALPPPSADTGVESYASVEEWRAAQQRERAENRGATASLRHAALIDLDTSRVVWSGPAEQAPSLAGQMQCARSQLGLFQGDGSMEPTLTVRVGEGSFVLAKQRWRSPTACAASADGSRLVVAALPFLHLYELAP